MADKYSKTNALSEVSHINLSHSYKNTQQYSYGDDLKFQTLKNDYNTYQKVSFCVWINCRK